MADDNVAAATVDDPLKPANELIRAAARWLIGALGAIGALLVAGSQLSSIGSLQGSDSRLKWAVVGLALSLVAILLAIWRMTTLLLPHAMVIDEIADDWAKTDPTADGLPWWRRWRHPAVHYLASHRQYLGGDAQRTVPQVRDAWWNAGYDEAAIAPLRGLIESIESIAAHEALLASFRRARWWISGLVLLAATGIGVFAWAANPGDDDLAPNLRNADLTGADLGGAVLEHADLTGADLTDANLHGAHLADAVIEDVVWSNTVCPDGTNSDDLARPDPEKPGQRTGGTCAGHLSPRGPRP